MRWRHKVSKGVYKREISILGFFWSHLCHVSYIARVKRAFRERSRAKKQSRGLYKYAELTFTLFDTIFYISYKVQNGEW